MKSLIMEPYTKRMNSDTVRASLCSRSTLLEATDDICWRVITATSYFGSQSKLWVLNTGGNITDYTIAYGQREGQKRSTMYLTWDDNGDMRVCALARNSNGRSH